MSKKQTLRDPVAATDESVREAATILLRGGLVAFPTETVYGLGANALDEDAVRGIFAAKGRPSHNPLIVHVVNTSAALELAADWPDAADLLAREFWPGPLTLILPKKPSVPDIVTAGLDTVALRVPAHPTAQALLSAAGIPVAAPSANRSMGISPTTAQHVRNSLGDRIDLILDGGPTEVGIESTVIDLSGATPAILRPGSIASERIERVIGLVDVGSSAGTDNLAPRPSPGMLDRHYAPRAELRLFHPEQRRDSVRAAAQAAQQGDRVGAIVWRDADVPGATVIRLPHDPEGYARQIYAALHTLDAQDCTLILVEDLPPGPEWTAIRDRLKRAATPA